MNSKTFVNILMQVMAFRNDLRSNKTGFYDMLATANNMLLNNNDSLINFYEYTIGVMMARLAIKMEAMQNAGVDPMHSSLTPEIVKDFRDIELMFNRATEQWNNAVSSEIETLTN
jgi:hypothetical protein